MTRRDLLAFAPALVSSRALLAAGNYDPGFKLVDVTAQAGLGGFRHNNGAFGSKYLPETLGPGCAFFDYDNDGWQDILLINSMDWPGHKRQRSTMRLYHNNRNGTFTDVTHRAGLDVELYGLGVAVGDFNNDGFPDLFVSCVGQSRLFQNTGRGTFIDVTERSGIARHSGLSSSALWFDYDRDGHLDLFVCNYVKWSAAQDIICTLDGKQKSYCTPEAYHGATCWLFHNRGDGTFEDVTDKSGLFDTSSKSLGAAMLDYDGDGWLDLFVANDTEPNKLYRNMRDGTFREVALSAGLAFSADGKARAGMGVDVGDYDNSGIPGLVVTNFDHEMLGLYKGTKRGIYIDQAPGTDVGRDSRRTLGFGCFFFDANLDGFLDFLVVNGHIDNTVHNVRHDVDYAQPPQLFLNRGAHGFRDVAPLVGAGFAAPKVGRGAAFGDYDGDGDLDVLITTNGGPAYLYRNDQTSGNGCIRFRLTGTKSNRDAIGATVRLYYEGETSSRMIKSGSSYLSQSELPVTFGIGRRDHIERAVLTWPSGRIEEYKNLKTRRQYECVEGKGIRESRAY